MTTKRKGMRLRRHFTIAVIAILELFEASFRTIAGGQADWGIHGWPRIQKPA